MTDQAPPIFDRELVLFALKYKLNATPAAGSTISEEFSDIKVTITADKAEEQPVMDEFARSWEDQLKALFATYEKKTVPLGGVSPAFGQLGADEFNDAVGISAPIDFDTWKITFKQKLYLNSPGQPKILISENTITWERKKGGNIDFTITSP